MSDKRKQELAELSNVMRHTEGRRVLVRMLRTFGVHSSAFSADPHLMAYNSGKRDAGLSLLEEMRAADAGLHAKILAELYDNG